MAAINKFMSQIQISKINSNSMIKSSIKKVPDYANYSN
jgi:hypothetical protein